MMLGSRSRFGDWLHYQRTTSPHMLRPSVRSIACSAQQQPGFSLTQRFRDLLGTEQLNKSLEQLQEGQSRMQKSIDFLQKGQSTTQEGQSRMQDSIDSLPKGQSTMQDSIDSIKEIQATSSKIEARRLKLQLNVPSVIQAGPFPPF